MIKFRQKSNKMDFNLEKVNFRNEIMNILFKLTSNEMDLSEKYEYSLYLENRKTKKVNKIKLDIVTEAGIVLLAGEVNIQEKLSFFRTGIIDAYIKIENKKETYRVSSQNYYGIEQQFYYSKETNEKVVMYTTIKGNLSIMVEKPKNIACLENIELNERGNLSIKGHVIIPKWNMKDKSIIKKELVISLDEQESIINIKNIERKDITEKYKQLGTNFDWSGFEATIDLYDEKIYQLGNKLLNLSVRVSYNNETLTLPIIDKKQEFVKESYVNRGGETCKVNLRTHNDELKIVINKSHEEVQLKSVYIYEDAIEINGFLPKQYHVNMTDLRKMNVILKNRKSNKEIELKCEVNVNKFKCNIDVNLFTKSESFEKGIFDIFIRIDEKMYRIVNKLDGILEKQKIVNLPQILSKDENNKACSIKAYYTIHDELSILVRNYVSMKKIEEVKVMEDKIIISGLLNIQQPNKNISDNIRGSISMNATYGRNYNFDGIWKLEYTEKTRLEFKFEFEILKEQCEKQNVNLETILENINFDLIKCKFNIDEIEVDFLMNIEPSKIQWKMNNNILSKQNGLKLYKIYNKILPINKNIAVFQSFHGKSYSCNPKAIYEELLKQNSDIKCVWVLNDVNKKLPGNPIIIRPNSKEYYYYMAIAKYFINNGNFPDFYEKREGTVHLQTWHGTPLKKLGFDIDESSPAYKENTSPELMRRNERWDYLIEPNKYTGDILKRAFKFKKEIISSGYPRNDVLIKSDENKIKEVKEVLNIPKNKKVILYAPTWRDYEYHSGSVGQPYEFKFDMDRFKQELGEDYVILLRLHYRDAARINITGYENMVYNVSSYDDIQELYLISDILITDYSSVMFDYANLNRPIIFFTYDLKRYGSEVRGFYFNFIKEAPGPIVLTQDRLFEAIKNINKVEIDYKQRYEKFREKFCSLEDGNSSSRVIQKVFK